MPPEHACVDDVLSIRGLQNAVFTYSSDSLTAWEPRIRNDTTGTDAEMSVMMPCADEENSGE